MDFVVGFPRTQKQYDFMWVVMDTLNQSTHFIPIKSSLSAEYYARIFIDGIVCHHGIPLSIISDSVHNSHIDIGDYSKKGWVPT